MIELGDPLWQTFKGGYRVPYDASVRLRELESGVTDVEDVWKEFWDELHHQGDVDIASYASVPLLVRICTARELLDWNPFALVAAIEECRTFGKNPQLPEWLQGDYREAIRKFAEFGARHYSVDWSKELTQGFLSVAAFANGQPQTGRLIIALTDAEMEEAYAKYFE